VRLLRGASGHINRLRFSADGRTLAALDLHPRADSPAGTADVCLWDATTGQPYEGVSIPYRTAPLTSDVFTLSPAGPTVWIAHPGRLQSWHFVDGEADREIELPGGGRTTAESMSWTRTGELTALTLRGQRSWAWWRWPSPARAPVEVARFRATRAVLNHTGDAVFLAQSGERSGQPAQFAILRDGVEAALGEFIPTSVLEPGPTGDTLAVIASTGVILIWTLGEGPYGMGLAGQSHRVMSVAFAPDGRSLWAGDTRGLVRRYDLTRGEWTATLEFGVGYARSLAVAPDGLTAAAGGWDGRVVLWDIDP
jgi:hypothetical protein